MSRLLLVNAIAKLPREVLPGDSADTIPWINAVTQIMFSVGKWAGTTVRWKGIDTATNFAIYNDLFGGRYVTLPRNLLCILGGAHGNAGDSLQARFSTDSIRGPWYEFSNSGWGAGDAVAGSGMQDAGDGFTCFRDITEDSYLRVKTEVAEAGSAEMLFRGLDEDEEPIYTGTGSGAYEGVKLVIGASTTTTTTQKFSSIPSLIRKPITYGPVRLYAVSVSDGTETLIGMYEPGDMTPSFRRYRIACESEHTTVHAMCKRRHVDALADADEVIPGNIAAITFGMHGWRYDLANDTKTSEGYWLKAFNLLNSELGEHHGGAVPRLQMERGCGLASIPRI